MACTCSQCGSFKKASAPEGFQSGYCALFERATTDEERCQSFKAAGGVFASDIGMAVEPNGLVVSKDKLKDYVESYTEISRGFGEG